MKISILGCGWLGLPLGIHLKKSGFTVLGSTTSEEKLNLLKNSDIDPFLISIAEGKLLGDISTFLEADVLFVNVPFGKQKGNYAAYEQLVEKIKNSSIQNILFISSTAVYKDINGVVTENEKFEINPAKEELVKFEKLFFQETAFQTTILRFSGLVGGTRNPGNFFRSDRIVQNGLAPINLIHLDDCISIIENILQKNAWGAIFNASADTHPTRKEFYTAAANQQNNAPATFIENEDFSFKIISNEKLKKSLNYSFIHPDLLKMLSHF